MNTDEEKQKEQDAEKKTDISQHQTGWLVVRVRPGEGVRIGDAEEIRVAAINNKQTGDVKLAIQAPKNVKIRRVT